MADQEREKKAAEAEATEQEAGASLVEELLTVGKLEPKTKTALGDFLDWLLKQPEAKVRQAAVNDMIAEIDAKLTSQVNAILHDHDFQKMEAAWRGLKYVIDETNFRENIRIGLVNVSKDDLLADFEDAPAVPKSGLYRIIYSGEYGVHGGEPIGAMIANYDFGPGSRDVSLLQYCASLGAMAHAPFVAAAGPQFFGEDEADFLKLPRLQDLHAVFEKNQYVKWNSFRDSDDSRYVGLALPRFLLREPYGSDTTPAKSFDFEEEAADAHDNYLWGNAAFALASRLTDSFAKWRFSANIIGPKGGGQVENLPVPLYEAMGGKVQKIPTEVLIEDTRELELAEEGFIPLVMRKGSDNACFFSANSAQRPKFYGGTKEGKEAEANFKLGTRLPYIFVISRLAHYLKVLQREELGTNKTRAALEKHLQTWIKQYVLDQDIAPEGSFARQPLRKAEVRVEDVEGDPGWYKVSLKVVPHFKYEGAFFELSLVGKLDKE